MNLVLITITICALAFTYYVWRFHDQLAERKAEAQLAKWKLKEEKAIREDAYQRSRAVSFGKTIEQLPVSSLPFIVWVNLKFKFLISLKLLIISFFTEARDFVENSIKKELKKITPTNYTGI